MANIKATITSAGAKIVPQAVLINKADKTDVGLGNVDNTSDANKPVSTAQQTALNLKADFDSPTFTGTVAIPNVANLETAVVANTAKLTNVSTNLSATANGTSLTVESSDGNNVALPAATTSAWGVMSDDQATKLDGIEASADVTDTANVTAAGALMDSELAGIAAVKATTGTFLTADQTKLDSIEASADVTDTANVTAAGALMDSECTNLAAVKAFTGEAAATADQTNAEIRAAVEAASDSNVFTDADHTKLNAISGTNTGDEAAATESATGIVELATSTEVESGWSSAAEKVVRSSHLRLKVEGGGIVLKGTTDPTSGGANTGVDSVISGNNSHSNTGGHCLISGSNNHTNTGSYCSISGQYNHNNSGHYSQISGKDNDYNAGSHCAIFGELNSKTGTDIQEGNHCLISGKNNYNNSGDYCSITGYNNYGNSGDYCSISGSFNIGNFGSNSIIGGKVAGGSTKIATSGTSATASTNLINKTGHGVTNKQPLRFTTLTGGAGLSTSTLYYARDILINTFKVSLTPGGTAVNITGDYSVANYIANGVNYGNFSSIAGEDNEGNSGSWCNISGDQNHTNLGDHCSISGSNNSNNSGDHCSISGSYNSGNSGNYCLISGHGGWFGGPNSGDYCSISGYYNSGNSGNYCLISGYYHSSNSGDHCSITGKQNSNNSGDYCSISGTSNINNSGDYCSISGNGANTNSLDYARVHGGKSNARIIDLVAQIDSSGTGATELLLGGTGGSMIIIPDQSAWACEVHFVAKTATGANASMQRVDGLIVRDGTSTTYAAGVADTQVNIGSSNATFAVAADDTNEALKLTVTAASGTVRCVANIKLTQVDY